MTKKETTLNIPKGIHLRVAGSLAKKAGEFNCDVFIEYNDLTVNCKSVMSVAVLGVMEGDKLKISAEGKDESKAVLSLLAFLENDSDNKTDEEIFKKYIVGASWMDTEGNIYIVSGFHQEWVERNSYLLNNLKTVQDVIEKLNWINIMIYKDKTIEFHVKDLSDSVLKRIQNFLLKRWEEWISGHIFTSQEDSLYVKVEKTIFDKYKGELKKMIDENKLTTQYYN